MPETKSYETVSANVAKVREQMKEAAERLLLLLEMKCG